MTLFQQILWMFVTIRLLGRQPQLPSCHESLVEYAAVLEIQYSRICAHVGAALYRESAVTARGIVGLLGLIEAAEPLPSMLLVMLQNHECALTESATHLGAAFFPIDANARAEP